MIRMITKRQVTSAKKTQKLFDVQSIRETLFYIMNGNNVQLLSWGTTRIKINGQKVWFQLIVRNVAIELMRSNYSKENEEFSASTKKVGQTLFCDIFSRLTKDNLPQRY